MKYPDKKLGRHRKGVDYKTTNKRDINHVLMTSKYGGKCRVCKQWMDPGTKIWWSSVDGSVYHWSERCFGKREILAS